ncbi:MAG: YjbQ family protein [bacterium]|nr:YjbQ family protein [bacterium]
MLETIEVNTRSRTEFIDITSKVRQVVQQSGIRSGMCYLFVPHTTASVTINENADPSVQRDMLMEMDKVIPFDDNYTHYEGNSAAHVKSSLFGNSLFVIIEDGTLVLGTWQGIYFCEFDGSRRRKVFVKVVEG